MLDAFDKSSWAADGDTISAYFTPPQTSNYTFRLEASSRAALFLAPATGGVLQGGGGAAGKGGLSYNATSLRQIAIITTTSCCSTKAAHSQRTPLVAGRYYYLEARYNHLGSRRALIEETTVEGTEGTEEHEHVDAAEGEDIVLGSDETESDADAGTTETEVNPARGRLRRLLNSRRDALTGRDGQTGRGGPGKGRRRRLYSSSSRHMKIRVRMHDNVWFNAADVVSAGVAVDEVQRIQISACAACSYLQRDSDICKGCSAFSEETQEVTVIIDPPMWEPSSSTSGSASSSSSVASHLTAAGASFDLRFGEGGSSVRAVPLLPSMTSSEWGAAVDTGFGATCEAEGDESLLMPGVFGGVGGGKTLTFEGTNKGSVPTSQITANDPFCGRSSAFFTRADSSKRLTQVDFSTVAYPYACFAYKVSPSGSIPGLLVYIKYEIEHTVTKQRHVSTRVRYVTIGNALKKDGKWHYGCIALKALVDDAVTVSGNTCVSTQHVRPSYRSLSS